MAQNQIRLEPFYTLLILRVVQFVKI